SENMALSKSSDEHVHSLMKTEPAQIDNILLFVKDVASQNSSNESDLEEQVDVSFET
ncbi:6879_t:CDS:1, partial [Dentiscutata heterogama]